MNHDEWIERAEIYAVGALDDDELRQFEAHLAAGCAVCEAHLGESRETIVQLPRSLAPLAPPPRIKAELLRRIAGEATVSGFEISYRWLWWGAGAGGLAAVSLLIVLTWNLIATRSQVRELQGQLAVLQTQANERDEVLQLLSNPQVQVVNLAALPDGRGASGQLLWNPVTRTGVLLVKGLPETPAERAYELWGLAGAEPVPAGVFVVDTRGMALLRLPKLPENKRFDKFAVTLEPAGGVPQPTGPMVLVGSV